MKSAAKLKILLKFLNASNNKEINFKSTTSNYLKRNYWDQECQEHPTNNSCLIYCD